MLSNHDTGCPQKKGILRKLPITGLGRGLKIKVIIIIIIIIVFIFKK